jgi:hypothetical protein
MTYRSIFDMSVDERCELAVKNDLTVKHYLDGYPYIAELTPEYLAAVYRADCGMKPLGAKSHRAFTRRLGFRGGWFYWFDGVTGPFDSGGDAERAATDELLGKRWGPKAEPLWPAWQ